MKFANYLNPNEVSTKTALSVVFWCVAFNIVLGTIIRKAGIPIYLDTLGTVIATILLGTGWGLVAGVFSVICGSIFIWPQYFWYSATAISIIIAIDILFRNRMFSTPLRSSMSGIIIAVIAALVSAPVTAHFQAATYSGNDLVTVFFRNMGNSLWNSIIFSGFSSEPIDKVITCLMSFYSIKSLPKSFASRNKLRTID